MRMEPALARVLILGIAIVSIPSAYGINAKFAQQLERSGCTQMSEQQGCDITKTKAENAKAGFVKEAPPSALATTGHNLYAGSWIAKNADGATVATIEIDGKERVQVNGKPVKAKRSDGALAFKVGPISYTIQGDRRLVGEDRWTDFDSGTTGPIVNR